MGSGDGGEAGPSKQMVTHTKWGRDFYPARQSLFENQVPANGIWHGEEGGFEFQQRYDKCRRPEPGRPSRHRRHRNLTIPDRGIVPLPQQECASA